MTDEDVEKYMKSEEHQVKGAYDIYAEDYYESVRKGIRTEQDCFKSQVSTVSYCLEMCY